MAEGSKFEYGNGMLNSIEVNGAAYGVTGEVRMVSPDRLTVDMLLPGKTLHGRVLRRVVGWIDRVLPSQKNP